MENIEMERKFIVDYDNSFIQHLREHFPKQEIVQYYIKTNTRTVMRLRKITKQNDDVEYFLTVKFNIPDSEHQTCYEVENKISKGMYESLVKTDEPGFIINAISKTRYYFSHDNHMFEIDVFDNSKHGLLILIEVEFEKDDVVVIPDYLKNLPGFREVTNDPQYFNCNLV